MTEGTGLRQSHFGSGYDAGKARLQAEVEQLKAQFADQRQLFIAQYKTIESLRAQRAAQNAVVEAALALVATEQLTGGGDVDYTIGDSEWQDLKALCARLDAADVPAATTTREEQEKQP